MTFLAQITFPISGVHTYVWLPPLVALFISFFTSMAGITGAFLLLPFQLSILGFTSPAVSSTNLVYNIIATPGGIFRFLSEKRLVWPLAGIILLGTLPGVFLGGFIRLHWLPDPKHFQVFAGFVLLYVGSRLLIDLCRKNADPGGRLPRTNIESFKVEFIHLSWSGLQYRFQEQNHQCKFPSLFILSFIVGILGSMYGIGGGAIIAPFLVTFYRLPIYTVAGATLMSTFVTSIAGVAFYELAAPYYGNLHITPDWMLGILFGLGGLCGMYLGARAQRYIPAIWLKLLLGFIVLFVAAKYLLPIFGL